MRYNWPHEARRYKRAYWQVSECVGTAVLVWLGLRLFPCGQLGHYLFIMFAAHRWRAAIANLCLAELDRIAN